MYERGCVFCFVVLECTVGLIMEFFITSVFCEGAVCVYRMLKVYK